MYVCVPVDWWFRFVPQGKWSPLSRLMCRRRRRRRRDLFSRRNRRRQVRWSDLLSLPCDCAFLIVCLVFCYLDVISVEWWQFRLVDLFWLLFLSEISLKNFVAVWWSMTIVGLMFRSSFFFFNFFFLLFVFNGFALNWNPNFNLLLCCW